MMTNTLAKAFSLLFCFSLLSCSPSQSEDAGDVPDVVVDVVAADVAEADVVVNADVAIADVIAPGGACAFNRECNPAERCQCSEANGCLCTPGPRGEGVLGEACIDGQDCESSLCLEGPGNDLLCSKECIAEEDCADPLPICTDIAFVGRICVRAAQ